MRLINIDDFLNELERKYGDLDRDSGCYCNGRWLSIARIVEIAENYAVWEPDDFRYDDYE